MEALGPRPDGETENAIAVVGMACRFPGDADNIENFWEMIRDGRDAWSEIPSDRFNAKGWYHPDPNRPGSFHIRGAHFIKGDIAAFDAPFFSISTAEAVSMDPQQRMLLEVVYEALDSAGIPMASLSNSATSVYCGSFVRDYEQPCMRDPDTTPPYSATGNGIAILANRISHAFDFAGTSQTIDTGCSASMIAVHQACKSLLSGESNIGIAAGVGLIFSPNTLVPMANLNILGSDGRCYTFDERANGYGRGEGAGVIVLKRLKDAIASNDTIRAVIRATASNQDGHTQGITLPSQARQVQNMSDIYRKSGLDITRTAYMECHGTGTQVGDVKETQAATELFCKHRTTENPLIIGSVKTNIGHLEGSAGVAGLIKGILTVERGFIPKHLNFKSPNKQIDFDRMKLKVATELTPWPVPGLRRASINSFGFGGTNAHVVIDDVPHFLAERNISGGNHNTHLFPDDKLRNKASEHAQAINSQLFVFSGHDERGLSRVIESQSKYVAKNIRTEGFEINYAYTLLLRRSPLNWRAYVVASSAAELLKKLENKCMIKPMRTASCLRKGLAFVFCGQGAQWHAMGRELLRYRVFYESISTASWYMSSILGSPFCLWDELHLSKDASRISDAQISQPATTAIQVALVDLLLFAGIMPTSVLGHSSGEIAAAYAAGAISREDSWRIAYYRGQSVSRISTLAPELRGGMLAVALSEEDARRRIPDANVSSVDVACINGPTSVTLSGDADGISRLHDYFRSQNTRATRVNVETAYHSHHMKLIEGLYRESLVGLGSPISSPRNTTFFSSVFGRKVQTSELGAEYWVKNLIHPVKFHHAAKAMIEESCPASFLEISPHCVWESTLLQIYNSSISPVDTPAEPGYVCLLLRDQDASVTTLSALGNLWAQGFSFSLPWSTLCINEGSMPRHLVDVPSYPWDHSKRFWHESHLSKANRFRIHGREDIIGAPLENSTPQDPRWRGFFRMQENPWLEDHVIQKSFIYPAGGMIAMAIEAAKQLANHNRVILGYEVSNFKILKPMRIPTTIQGLEHMLSAHIVDEGEDGYRQYESTYTFSIQSKPPDGPWTTHAKGRFSAVYCKDGVSPSLEMEQLFATSAQRQACHYVQKLCHTQLNPRQFYESLDVIGMTYGPQFRNLVNIERSETSAHAVVEIPDTKARMPFNFEFDHIIHPATLDTMLQTVLALGDDRAPMLPCSAGRVFVAASLPKGSGSRFRGYANAREAESEKATADIVMFDEELRHPAVVFEDLLFKSAANGAPSGSGGFLPSNRHLCSEIVWKQDVSTIAKLGLSFPTSIQEIIDLISHRDPALSILYHVPSVHLRGCSSDVSDDRIQHLSSIAEALKITKLVLDNLTTGYETPRFSRCLVSGADSDKVWHHMHTIKGRNAGFDRIEHAKTVPEDERFHLVFCSIDEKTLTGSLSEDLEHVADGGWLIILPKMSAVIDTEQYGAVRAVVQAAGFRVEKSTKGGPFLAAQRISMKIDLGTIPVPHCGKVTILLPSPMSSFVSKMKSILCPLLENQPLLKIFEVDINSVSNLQLETDDSFVLSLVEVDYPLISTMGSELFQAVHRLLTRSRGVLWLTKGAQVDCKSPDRSPILGLARSLRSEDSTMRIVTLDISTDFPISSIHGDTSAVPEALINSIVFLLQEHFTAMPVNKTRSACSSDVEFAYCNGRLMIPRLMPLSLVNSTIEKDSTVSKVPLLSMGRALKLDVSTLASADGPRFVGDDEVLQCQLQSNQVRIAVAGTHILPEDIISVSRGTPAQNIGTDVFGFVLEAGSGVADMYPGCYVVARMKGTLKTHVIVGSDRVRRVDHPSNWRGSCPTAFATAVYALNTSRRIMKGDSVLVYGTSSAYGQAAIRVALALGGNVIVACMTAGEKFIAQEHLKVPPSHILDLEATSDDFEAHIKALTFQLGVDVVFDPTSCHIEQSFSCVAECGRVVRVAQKNCGTLVHPLADKNVSFETVDIDLFEDRKPLEARRLFSDVEKMLQVFPGLDSVCCTLEHNMCDLQTTLSQASINPFIGPHLLFTEADKGENMVNTQTHLGSKTELSSSATYLLVGGFGGLGRSIAEHLVRCGARHIAFLSRSGASSASAQSLFAKMQASGVHVRAFATDICDKQQLSVTLEELNANMPPIRGAIQCAAVVDDAVFPSMTYERWRKAFEPKALGSNNLHEQLPHDMDFLIFLSSSSGIIGNRGQANYSAGNCFQDALARHRTELGMHSVSIDFGLVLGAGMVAENEVLLDTMKSSGFIGIRIQDALSILDRAMARPGMEPNMHVPAQIVTAVGTGGLTIQNQPSDPFWTRTALFRYLNQVDAPPHGLHSKTHQAASQDLQSAICMAATIEEASQAVCKALIATVARRKGMVPGDFDQHQSLGSYGIDSLDSIFLLGWISRETGVTLQTVEGVAIAELSQTIARRVLQAVEEDRQ